jgi:predicted dehydrogenase
MDEMTLGVVGCGKQGEKHLRAINGIAGVKAVCVDTDAALALDLAKRQGAVAGTWERVLDDPEVRGVVICTPTPSHGALIEGALRAGKHVLVEKPLAVNTAEARRVVKLEEETGRFVMVGFIYRFAPAFERAHEVMRGARGMAAALGEPVYAILRIGGRGEHQAWKHLQTEGGGVINEMMVHMVDLAQWLFGPLSDPMVKSHSVLLPERTIRGRKVTADAPDYLVAEVRTESGAPVLFICDMVTPAFTQYVDAQFTNGSFMGSIQPTMPTSVFLKEPRGGLDAGATPIVTKGHDLYAKQMRSFVDAVASNLPPDRNRAGESIAVMTMLEELRHQAH